MTEQNNDLFDAFDKAIADSADSAGQNTEISADALTDQTGNNEPADTTAEPGAQQHDGQHAESAQQQEDPWLAAPEPLRNQFQQLQQKLATRDQEFNALQNDHRANAGRVAALNRKAEELQQQLAAREAQGIKGPDGAPTAADLKDKSFEQIKAEFPEIADVLEQKLGAIREEFTQQFAPVKEILSERQQQRQAAEQQQAIQNEFSQLQVLHPDCDAIAKDPAFHAWAQSQPADVQALYVSTSARDNAVLLRLFKTTPAYQQKAEPAKTPNNLADHVATPRQGSGSPTATRRNSDNFEDQFHFSVTHG